MATQPQVTAGGPRQLLLVAALVAVLLLIVGLLVVRHMLGGTDTGQTAPPAVTSAERQVALVGISGGTAKVTVDGNAYTVSEGETFATDYRATDINSECASFESGTTSFTLCEGEAVLK